MRHLVGLFLSGIATVVLYVLFLGWNTPRDLPGCTGPYEPWQVVGLAAVLALAVAVSAVWRVEWAAAGAAAITVTVLFGLDAITVDDPCLEADASLWPVGAMFLLVGSTLGLGLVALFAMLVRRAVARRRAP